MGVDSGTAELTVVAAEFLTALELTLSTGSLTQQAAGEPVRFDVTVIGVSNKGTDRSGRRKSWACGCSVRCRLRG